MRAMLTQRCTYSVATLLLISSLLLNVPRSSTQTTTPAETPIPISHTSKETTCEAGSGDCLTATSPEHLETTKASPTTSPQPSTSSSKPSSTTETRKKDTTTSTGKLSQSTPPPTTTPAPSQQTTQRLSHEQEPLSDSGDCPCDLTAFECDVNCCCDADCSAEDRLAFSRCKTRKLPPHDNRYCYTNKLVFRNNTEHILQETQNGAFCIVRSNLVGSTFHPERRVVTSQQDFNQQWDRSHPIAWPDSLTTEAVAPEEAQLYIAGAPIRVMKKTKLHTLNLPSAGFTSACTSVRTIRYLESWSSHCVHRAPENEAECEYHSTLHYHNSLNIVRSPASVNQSELLVQPMDICDENICAPVNTFLCPKLDPYSDSISNCVNVSKPQLLFSFNPKTGICHGVVKKLKYIFYHNGTHGIQFINLYLWLSNFSVVQATPQPLHQKFSVEFHWLSPNRTLKSHIPSLGKVGPKNVSQEGLPHKPFSRSGHPGYIVGKPVLAGFLVNSDPDLDMAKEIKPDAEKPERQAVESIGNKGDKVALPGAQFDGSCDFSSKVQQIVTFGENLHVSCSVTLTSSDFMSPTTCSSLRVRMIQLLLGSSADRLLNSSQISDWGRVVAAFGSADTSDVSDWVPLLLDELPASLLLPQQSSGSMPTVAPTSLSQSAQLALSPTMHTCENIPLGIQLRIMYAFVGDVSNPHAKIVGASLRFMPMQDIPWDCLPPLCAPSSDHSALMLRVVSTVTFIDMSSPAVTRFAEPPAIHIRLPPDFFYPFLSGDSSAPSLYSLDLVLYVIVILWLLQFSGIL